MGFWLIALAFGYAFCGLGALNLDTRSGMGRPAYVRDQRYGVAIFRMLIWPWGAGLLGGLMQLVIYTALSAGAMALLSWLLPIEWAALLFAALWAFLVISNLAHLG